MRRNLMMNKLELFWVGKDKTTPIETRILIEKPELSYKKESLSLFEDGIYDNLLIHGDNLLALKSLLTDYSGKIKCIYIDPPYNTGSAFEHYDDNLEHSTWLSLMRERLYLLRQLLAKDGTIWISIDDDEGHYLKVLCDEIFGRANFVSTVIWEKKFSPQNDAKWLSDCHDFILVYAKSKESWRPNLLPRTEEMNGRYKNLDNDPRGPWTSGDCLRKDVQESGLYEIITPSGRVCVPPTGRSWRFSKDTFEKMVKENRIWFGSDGTNVPRVKRFLSEVKQGITAMTIWKHTEVGHNQEATQEVRVFNNDNPFETPKPERLIQRILSLATNEGDLVLDSFLGSGTTCAVAHKMKRKWIGIEMGDHAYTHCKKRIDMVIDGKDLGGITNVEKWNGGGGYKFYELAPSLIVKDAFGEPIINKDYNPEMLASAVALHEGFTFNPDSDIFWKQSKSNENSYLFVTTMYVNVELLKEIESQMAEDEFLIIACKAYDKFCSDYSKKINIKKIPQMLLGKCEFGKDDYNLNIVNPPVYEEEYDDE